MMDEWILTYRGEVAALLSALLWAIAAVLYQQVGDRIPPLQLTLLKGVIAIALILLTLCCEERAGLRFRGDRSCY